MTMRSTAGLATVALLLGSIACAGNRPGEETGAAQDTSEAQNPPGYRGMETDTTQVPDSATPVDTFLQEQGTGQPADTQGYGGLEHPDTTGAAGQAAPDTSTMGADTSGMTGADTSGMTGADTSGMTSPDTSGMTDTSGMSGQDTSGMSGTSDTGQSGWDTTGQQ
jgi:hypothetical protein